MGTDRDRSRITEGVCNVCTDIEWQGGSLQHLRGSSSIRKEEERRSHAAKPGRAEIKCCIKGGDWTRSLNHSRSVSATWPAPGVCLSTCDVCFNTLSRRPGRRRERAAEIMLVAESSCGFPIFGNGKSSGSCGCTGSIRASCSCSNARSSHSKQIYSFRDAGRSHSPGVTGASSPCGHSVECTCSRSCRCTAVVKLSTAVQLSVVTAGLEGAVVQDTEWPVWLMKATWIRLLKRAKGGHVKSSDACVSSFWVCLHHESRSDSCACACVWCGHYFIPPSTAWSQCGTIS